MRRITQNYDRVRQWRLHKTRTSERGCRLNTRHDYDCERDRRAQRHNNHDERFSRFRNAMPGEGA
jgi:hypothetical protein